MTSSEYRQLSEMAITAQEHADLKLGEINMRINQLSDQLAAVRKILKGRRIALGQWAGMERPAGESR